MGVPGLLRWPADCPAVGVGVTAQDFLTTAYQRLRLPEWPDMDTALAHPLRGRCIRGYAAALARRAAAARRTPPADRFDAKRAAANDLEDRT